MDNCCREHELTRKFVLWALAIIASLAVFSLYTRPDFLFTLASQVWGCF
jgi:hypothetical protein